MLAVVQKGFAGPKRQLTTGTLVDTDGARNEKQLLACRFIRPATDSEMAAATAKDSKVEIVSLKPPKAKAQKVAA